MYESSKLKEACGVFGIYAPGNEDMFQITKYALYALQHRGQESAGIALSDGEQIYLKKGIGLVSEAFSDNKSIADVNAVAAIGHVNNTIEGMRSLENAQPLLVRSRHGYLAVAHNGNLINDSDLKYRLEMEGSVFQTSTDSELIAHLIARYGYNNLETSIKTALPYLQGAYALVLMTEKQLLGVRDPHGIRPLSLGLWSGHYVLASETSVFNTIGAETVRDINPGEMVIIDQDGLKSVQVLPVQRNALCIFEYIYFARPDSHMSDRNVHLVRKELGRQLARECPADADIVTGVPDSSMAAASGYAEEIGLSYEMGLIKNRYIGRTFIRPLQRNRDIGVQLKLNPVQKVVEGKRVIVRDDSIVRGTTSKKLVDMLFRAKAKEVHLRISSSPVISPCYYGINTPTYEELIGYKKDAEDIRREINATSLGFLSREGMLRAVGMTEDELCMACFTGNYPI